MRKRRKLKLAAENRVPSPNAMERLIGLKFSAIAKVFTTEHFSFLAICGYLIVEYVRPQSIRPALDILPWGKMFIALSAIAWLADPKKKWTPDPANKWMVAFLGVIVLASFTAYWPDVSRAHFMDFFGWFVAYFLIINIVNTKQRFLVFLLLFLLASFKLAQFGARTWAARGFAFADWGLMGPPGYFQNSGELAIQMAIFAPIAYQFAIAARPWLAPWKFKVLLLGAIMAAMTVLGSSTRGGQLALGVQTIQTLLNRRIPMKALIAIVAAAIVGWTLLPAEQKTRFSEMGEDTTSQQRLLYWENGLEMIKDHPLLGVGYFNFRMYYDLHYPDDVLFKGAELPHNIFIQIGTDAGVVGLLFYLALIYRAFRCTKDVRLRARSDASAQFYATLSHGFDAAFVGFLVAGQFVTVAYYPFMWIHLALVVSLRNIVVNASADGATSRSSTVRAGDVPGRGVRVTG